MTAGTAELAALAADAYATRTPEQRAKLDAMFERREAERRKNNDPGR